MSESMLVATRKGLLTLVRTKSGWSIARTDFPGIPVTAALHDARDGTLYAMLKHGHFGTKLHRSDDGGCTWTELPAPAFQADLIAIAALGIVGVQSRAERRRVLAKILHEPAAGRDVNPGCVNAPRLPSLAILKIDRIVFVQVVVRGATK